VNLHCGKATSQEVVSDKIEQNKKTKGITSENLTTSQLNRLF